MGKVVYRKKKSRSPYPLLILGAVVVFWVFAGKSGVSQARPAGTGKPQRPRSCRRSAFRHCWTAAGRAGLPAGYGDQFALRDVWVNTQRAADEIVFQKVEEGGILLGRTTGCLRSYTVDDATQKQLAKNVQAVSDFAAAHPGKVTFLLAPSASVIYPELPTSAPMADENAMLDDIFTTVGQNASVLDLRHTFTADKERVPVL